MTRTGRPKLPKGQAKLVTVALRVTPDDRKAMGRAAKSGGVSFAQWAREALIAAVKGST